jgi:hypothetical protein
MGAGRLGDYSVRALGYARVKKGGEYGLLQRAGRICGRMKCGRILGVYKRGRCSKGVPKVFQRRGR